MQKGCKAISWLPNCIKYVIAQPISWLPNFIKNAKGQPISDFTITLILYSMKMHTLFHDYLILWSM